MFDSLWLWMEKNMTSFCWNVQLFSPFSLIRKSFDDQKLFNFIEIIWWELISRISLLKGMTLWWFHEKKIQLVIYSQCGNRGNLLSNFFDKNFVKVTVLLKKTKMVKTAIFDILKQSNVRIRFSNTLIWRTICHKIVALKFRTFHCVI